MLCLQSLLWKKWLPRIRDGNNRLAWNVLKHKYVGPFYTTSPYSYTFGPSMRTYLLLYGPNFWKLSKSQMMNFKQSENLSFSNRIFYRSFLSSRQSKRLHLHILFRKQQKRLLEHTSDYNRKLSSQDSLVRYLQKYIFAKCSKND